MSHFGVSLFPLICIQEVVMDVKTEISKIKSELLPKKISDYNGDQKNFSKLLTPCEDKTSKLHYQSMIHLSLWPQL